MYPTTPCLGPMRRLIGTDIPAYFAPPVYTMMIDIIPIQQFAAYARIPPPSRTDDLRFIDLEFGCFLSRMNV